MKDDSDNELYHQEVMQLDGLLQQSSIGDHDSQGDPNIMVTFKFQSVLPIWVVKPTTARYASL